MKKQKPNWVVITIVAIVFTMLGVVAAVLQQRTIINCWKPALTFGVLALVVGFLWRGSLSRWLRISVPLVAAIAGAAMTWSAELCLFYTTNYCFSRPSTAIDYEARVTRKYSQQRYRYVGRRGTRRVPYTAYCIDVQMPQGRVKTFSLTASQYVKARKGQKLPATIEQGLFGIPVVKNITLPGQKHNTSEN